MLRYARLALALTALSLILLFSPTPASKPTEAHTTHRTAPAVEPTPGPELLALRNLANRAENPRTRRLWEMDGLVDLHSAPNFIRDTPDTAGKQAAAAKPPEEPQLPAVARIGGDGPWMPGQRVIQTDRLDFFVGRGSFTPEQLDQMAPQLEAALDVMEQRFGERLRRRISLGFYRSGPKDVRGLAYTEDQRAELFYRQNESPERAVVAATHELAHHLQAQRYGTDVQKRADTILLEGGATWIAGDRWLPMTGASSWKKRARQLRDAGVPLKLLTAERYGANNAYELWASFVQFLLERYGQNVYRPLYQSGHGRACGSADYQGVIGKSIDELAGEWRDWVNE